MYDGRVFEELAQAVEELSIPADGRAIAAAFALRDRLDAKLADAVGAFDAADLWDIDGATSMTAWLRSRTGRSRRDSARTAATAARLAKLPVTATAWAEGRLSAGQVEAICTHLDSATVEVVRRPRTAARRRPGRPVGRRHGHGMAMWKARATADGTALNEAERSLHLSSEPGAVLQPSSSPAPSTRLARQTPP
jgi:Domain of unknown function (DUF222)